MEPRFCFGHPRAHDGLDRDEALVVVQHASDSFHRHVVRVTSAYAEANKADKRKQLSTSDYCFAATVISHLSSSLGLFFHQVSGSLNSTL